MTLLREREPRGSRSAAASWSSSVAERAMSGTVPRTSAMSWLSDIVSGWLSQDSSAPPTPPPLVPINALRNAAVRAARTVLVVLLDVDLLPSAGLHKRLSEPATARALRDACAQGHV
jgi:hypothetical protein